MKKLTTPQSTLEANILVHSALAESGEYTQSPHFFPENQKKVRRILKSLCEEHLQEKKSKSLLDMGCGTGFVINLAHDLFDTVHGIDITDAMMSLVDISPGNIELFNCPAEATPFADCSYEMVTAYSFLDHLTSYEKVLREAYRLLTPGGVFYSDLNPNKHFSSLLKEIEQSKIKKLPDVVSREIRGMLHNGDYYQEKFGINSETLDLAEPIKSFEMGIDPEELTEIAKTVGFSSVQYVPDWFLGQAIVTRDRSEATTDAVDRYLRFILPASLGLYKYLRFVLIK